ncbi:MAG: UvrD-helicase domain-containing protein [Treponema sp.]|nr:UvrD-helicase domain-containing protein [Treponema sp.]
MSPDEYLEVLNPQQAEAVVHQGGSLLILAGAGSGKTRVITTKIAYLISQMHVDPYSILAVTFTKKAAEEMRERAVRLEPKSAYAQIRTFHSFGAYFLRKYWQYAGLDKNFTVYDDDDMVTLVSKALPGLTKKECSSVAHGISLAKDYCLVPESQGFSQIGFGEEFALQYEAYEKRLRDTGNVDFGDLILLPYLVLKNEPSVRKEIYSRYRVIMVDEYQDSNVAQYLLLQQLAGLDEKSGIYVCVVGDDDQSIYKFRGAEVKNILNFQKQFPDTKLVRLETNYRSTSQILACADSVVKNNFQRLGKTLVSSRGKGKKPVLAFLENQDEECEFCSQLIENAHEKGVPYSDWAILYRTNAQSLGFESLFLRKKIPYRVVGTLKFYEREEVKDLLAWLSFIANPRDEIAFRRIVNKPARAIGNVSQEKIIESCRGQSVIEGCRKIKLSKKAAEGISSFVSLFDEFENMVPETDGGEKKKNNLAKLVESVSVKSGLEDYHRSQDEIAGTQKVSNIQELANAASLYPCTKSGLLEFLDHVDLDRSLENESEDSTDCVTLITLHNTKGLEFNRVIITGMEHGVFPREDKAGEEIEEERRLFYVGITRAKDELYMTSCAMRRMYGQTKNMYPSPFLNEIDPSLMNVIGEKPSAYEPGLASGEDPVAKKWRPGARVYHDDYGYGVIVLGKMNEEGEYVISVSFETGGVKRFLPKYQKSLILEGND